jgi:hypothetical protein
MDNATRARVVEENNRIDYTEAANSDSDCVVQSGNIGTTSEEIEMINLDDFLEHRSDEGVDDAKIIWTLCGKSNIGQQIGIDLEEYRVSHAQYSISTDIDSVICSSAQIPTNCDIQYIPFSGMHASLQRNNHIYRIVGNERVRLSTIPNQMIGRFGDGGAYTLLEFFPNMRRKQESGWWMSSVDHQHRKYWYDQVLWPCVQQVIPRHEAVHWPASYEDARERSTFQGTFNYQWYWMQRTHVEELWRRVNERVDELGSEGQMFQCRFYHVFCRGVKLRSMRTMDEYCRGSIEEMDNTALFQGLSIDMIKRSDDFLVDIGMEYLPGTVNGQEAVTMVWARDMLYVLMRKYMGNARRVRIDEFCSLSCVAGVSAEAAEASTGVGFGVVYMQAYMNNKGPLYGQSVEGDAYRFSKSMSLERAFKGGDEYGKRMDIICDGLKRGSNREWSARLELRLPYHKLVKKYNKMVTLFREICSCGEYVYTLPTEVVYRLQMTRLEACSSVVERVQMLGGHKRVHRGVLTLLATVVWIMNALISRPQDTSEYEWIRLWSNRNESVRCSPRARNLFFLSDIDLTGLRVGVSAAEPQLRRLYGARNLLRMRKQAANSKLGRISSRHKARICGMIGTRVTIEEDSDLTSSARNLMESFGRDLWSIIPNGRSGGGYLLAEVDVEKLGLEHFRDNRVECVISRGYFMDEPNWKQRFDLYFPSIEQLGESWQGSSRWKQGWERLRYRESYMQWMLQHDGRDDEIEEFRNLLYAIFGTLGTLPNSQKSGKVWPTRRPKGKQETHLYLVRKIE